MFININHDNTAYVTFIHEIATHKETSISFYQKVRLSKNYHRVLLVRMGCKRK